VSDTQNLLRFGVFELNVTTEELRKSGTLIRLAPQPIKLLALLARRSGQVVTREEIQQALWGEETYVDFEQGMNHCIKQIRNALSDSADTPLYVETVPRRGYRFLAPVVTKTIPAPPPRVVESQSGIQSNVTTQRPGVLPTAQPVVTDPTAVLRAKPPVALQPIPETSVAVIEEKIAAGSGPWKLVVIVAVVVALILAVVLYLRSRRTARLEHHGRILAAQVKVAPSRLSHLPLT
jgi:DNA-binding winged helix-turn-helix (wHTH) protein